MPPLEPGCEAWTPRRPSATRHSSRPATSGSAREPQLERGSLDLLRDYAQPYSIALICRLLGVPLDRQRDLLDWSHAMVKMYELDTSDSQADAAERRGRGVFRGYVLELIAERRRSPRDDMIGALAEARVDGGRLSDDEIVSTVIVLLNAGHEATVNTLGNGIRALAPPSRAVAGLVAGEVDAAAAIDELIRWDPPLQLFERWVLEDGVEVAGVTVPRGEKLALLFGAANRDPRVFPEPGRLDLARANAAAHIGFGGGIHVCIGAPLARLELAAGLQALVDAAPGLELVAEPRRLPAFVIWGFESVPVRLR